MRKDDNSPGRERKQNKRHLPDIRGGTASHKNLFGCIFGNRPRRERLFFQVLGQYTQTPFYGVDCYDLAGITRKLAVADADSESSIEVENGSSRFRMSASNHQ